VRLALAAQHHLNAGGSITLTSGIVSAQPIRDGANATAVNHALEGFVRAAALELPRGIRVNVVSPPWVSETLEKMGQSPSGGVPAVVVARAYVEAVEGTRNGQVLDPRYYEDESL
jgi:NAD(P)-dependent dehydrogenase (short-subunit alcohol dehydrogenase family)